MRLRPTQSTIFGQVRFGLTSNSAMLVRAQEQISSGRRIVRPSDDAAGTSVAMSLRRQIGSLKTFVSATGTARPQVEQAAARLEEASGLVTEGRSLIIQGMNGSLGPDDREQIASQLEQVYARLLDVANSQSGDRYLFAGTKTDTRPFEVQTIDGQKRVVYQGDSESQRVLIGRETTLQTNVAGDEVFAHFAYERTRFGGVTGVAGGMSGDTGSGYDYLVVRQDGTSGALGAGVALVNNGADTLVGDATLSIDGAARTVQLGDGPTVAIPSPAPANLYVADERGASVRLDLSGWSGADVTSTLSGAASVSLDGVDFTSIDLTETDLQLRNDETGAVVHVDTTGIFKSGSDLVTFVGTPNMFDSLQGIIDDLRNGQGVDRAEMIDRIGDRLREFDRSQSDLLLGLGRLGATARRIQVSEERLSDLSLDLQGLVSNVEDADFAVTALELTRSEQTLQLAQATGARIIQQTFLNFLR